MTTIQLEILFRRDLPSFIIGTILCTVGLGFAVFSPRGARRDLIPAGLFAFLYGVRMFVRNGTTAHLLGHPSWLAYLASAFEYLVPIPGSIVFARYLGARWRRLNQGVIALFSIVAAVAIPFEIIARRPGAANNVVNATVVVLMAVFLLNYFTQPRLLRNIVTAGMLVFGLFVINEHFGWPGAEPPRPAIRNAR